MTTPSAGQRILQACVASSVITVLVSAVVLLFGRQAPVVAMQMFSLVAFAWLVFFGIFRLFVTGAMWMFDAFASAFADALPSLAGVLHSLVKGLRIFFEGYLIIGFFALHLAAIGISFGWVTLGS